MNHITASIEQLELAASELGVNSAAHDRMALILTDNIVELMLHHRCAEELQWDKRRWNPHPKYEPSDRKKVLGQHFHPKVKFCKDLGALTADEAEFVGAAHEYRNELYHAGIRHDPIIHALAWHYHNLACDLLKAVFSTSAIGWLLDEHVSPTVKKYLERPEVVSSNITQRFSELARELAQAKPACKGSLNKTLAAYLTQRCEELEHSLTFLVADNPNGLSESEMLTHIQFHEFMFGDNSPHLADIAKCASCHDLHRLMQSVRQNWKPPVPRNPLPRWRERTTGLSDETDRTVALKKFKQLDDEMWDFEQLVNDAAVTMAVELDL